MKLNKNTPIMLYGAGEVGEIIGKNILAEGYNLAGYLDKKTFGKTLNGVPVYSPEETFPLSDDYLIVVCLSDGTLHKEVAEILYSKGFKFLVFIPFGYRFDDVSTNIINNIYDAFHYGYIESIKNIEIESYENLTKKHVGYERYINSQDNNWINMYVDVEQLYTESWELWEGDLSKLLGKNIYNDINIWFYRPYMALMETLLGKGDYLSEYWDAYETLPFNKLNRIKNREKLIEEFEYHKSRNDSFFVESAPKAVLNPMGYWNLQGGHHRTGYLLAKGETFLPVLVRKNDYEKWCNLEIYIRYRDKIDKLSEGRFKTKINHPVFINYDGEREMTTNRIFRDVFSCLEVVDATPQSFLDYSDMDGFFSRNVIRQRLGDADFADNPRIELVRMIDEVLHVYGVNYLDNLTTDKHYDVVFFINKYNDLKENFNVLVNSIAEICLHKLFIEISIEEYKKIDRKLIECGFKCVSPVHMEVIDGTVKEIFLYEK